MANDSGPVGPIGSLLPVGPVGPVGVEPVGPVGWHIRKLGYMEPVGAVVPVVLTNGARGPSNCWYLSGSISRRLNFCNSCTTLVWLKVSNLLVVNLNSSIIFLAFIGCFII